MISAIFRRGGDVAFVVEELKAIFDPQGGQWMGGRYVPSLLAAIGQVIEDHMTRSGFLVRSTPAPELGARAAIAVGAPRTAAHGRGKLCPRCSALSLHRREGCLVCDSCGYSKCG
jgi:ribonucleoside-diphosphate reductase alpha chain